MDSHHWHQHAHAASAPSPAPEPWTATRLARSDPGERQEYAATVRRHLRSTSLYSPKHDQLSKELDLTLVEVEDEPPGARTIISVSAPFAVGKSTLIKQWGASHYRRWTPAPTPGALPERADSTGTRYDFVPIIYVTLMARSKAKDLHGAILTFLGYPSRGTISEITLRTTTALRNHHVRLIIVDDAHMLHTSSVTGRETLDALKQINTELGEFGGTIVLVGANLTNGPALSDPQIRARLAEHHLTVYDPAAPGDAALWQDMLATAEAGMRPYLPELSHNSLPTELAGLIFKRTQGFIGDAATLLAGATYTALASGRTHLAREDITGVRLSKRADDGESALTSAPENSSPARTTRDSRAS